MESRWRFNVWWTGWVGGPFRKAARLVNNPLVAMTDYRTPEGLTGVISRNPADMRDWITGGLALQDGWIPPFPYGLEVEPDSPM